jgi:hypothetical protein
MWLGPAEHENETVFGRMDENWDIDNDETFGDQVELLCRRPYFSRQWIVQEVLLAKRATVFSGSQFIFWSMLALYIDNNDHGVERSGGKFVYELAWKWSKRWKRMRRLPLINLLVNGKLYCHDFRDRIFSFVSLADDLADLEEVIVDYEAETWELFFGLLEIFRPCVLVSFACILYNVLEVPSVILIEQFNSGWAESATMTELQRLSQVFKRNVKDQNTSYCGNTEDFDGLFMKTFNEATICPEKLSDSQFYPICASLSENFGTLTKICQCYVRNDAIFLRIEFRPTIFGYILKDIFNYLAVKSQCHFLSNTDCQRCCTKLQRVYNRLISNNQVSNLVRLIAPVPKLVSNMLPPRRPGGLGLVVRVNL